MSPGLLRRARWHYAGIGLNAGGARVWVNVSPPSITAHWVLTNPTTSVIRGMSALLPGPGGPE